MAISSDGICISLKICCSSLCCWATNLSLLPDWSNACRTSASVSTPKKLGHLGFMCGVKCDLAVQVLTLKRQTSKGLIPFLPFCGDVVWLRQDA